MAVTEPPVCRPCVRLATRLCPALRREGAVAVRARTALVSGVHGTLFRCDGGLPAAMDEITVAYDDPRRRWMRAAKLVREIGECAIVPMNPDSPLM